MRTKKDYVHTFLWAIAAIIIVPLLFSFIPSYEKNEESQDLTISASTSTESVYNDKPLIQGTIEIKDADLSGTDLKNETKYTINASELSFVPLTPEKDKPSVLIIHTYGTQAYSDKDYIESSSTLKSKDNALNVICAGNALAQRLTERGLTVIHDKTLYDEISYSKAYELSINAVRECISKNPSIKYVIDIQRDSLFSQNGNCVRSMAVLSGEETAQILFISGSEENGADFPNWKNNLSLSLALSQKLKETAPKLTRGVALMPSGYGQYVCEGFITVEIGTSGNTPLQAQRAAVLLADAFYETVAS